MQTPSTSDIIDGESMLIETAGFLFLKSCSTKMKGCGSPDNTNIIFLQRNIVLKKNLLNDDVTGGRVSEPAYET